MSNIKTKTAKVSLITCSVLSALVASSLQAQEKSEQTIEKIFVTGSRISSSASLSATSPILSIGGDDIRGSGQIDIGTLLRESPQLQASLPGSFSAFSGEPLGASLLDLRSLGEERTLVIEDGRRHIAGIEGTGAVDVNTISTALLGNVEVLTGGASAIYGADAVSGVVNFSLRDASSFDGTEIRLQTGVTDDGDANEFYFSIADGVASNKGSMVFALEYQSTSPVFARDRDFAGSGLFTQVANSASVQDAFGVDGRFANVLVPDQRLPISSASGVISLSGSAFNDVFDSGGALGCGNFLGSAAVPSCQTTGADGFTRAYNPGDVFVGPFAASGGDGVPVEPDLELILPESDRVLVQAVGNYELHDAVNFFVNTKFVMTETIETNQVNGFNDDIPIALDNPFIPANLQGQINGLFAEGVPVNLVMSRDVLDNTTNPNPIADRKSFRIVTGFEGYIPGTSIDYEIFYNFGRTAADITTNVRLEDRYFAAIDAVIDPSSGNIVCRSDLDSSAIPPSSPFPAANADFAFNTFSAGDGSCVPVNLFGENSISAEAAAFIFQPDISRNDLEQQNFVAVLSGDTGDFFELPAGAIGFALGYEYRKESSSFRPGNFGAAGLTFGSQDSQAGPINPSDGEYSVDELFIEVRVPLLDDVFLADMLEVSGAFRTSDYDPYGRFNTWNVGSRWAPVESLTFRATYSEATRVPNINEAFAPTFLATLGAEQDPCNQNFLLAGSEFRLQNCIALIGDAVANGTYDSTNFLSAFVPGTTGGNENLNPEQAETITVGVVWAPTTEFGGAFDGFTATLDYYDIRINGLIDSLTGFQIAQNCVDAPTINNVFCDAVQRDATNGFITDFQSGFINLAAVETSGIDFQFGYKIDLAESFNGKGEVALSINGTRFLEQDETRDESAPDEITDVLGTFGIPKWIVNANIDYTLGDYVFGIRGRYEDDQLVTDLEIDDLISNPDFINVTNTGDAFVLDVSLSYSYSDSVEFFGGINNALEAEPFIGSLGRPAGPRGRFMYFGMNFQFK